MELMWRIICIVSLSGLRPYFRYIHKKQEKCAESPWICVIVYMTSLGNGTPDRYRHRVCAFNFNGIVAIKTNVFHTNASSKRLQFSTKYIILHRPALCMCSLCSHRQLYATEVSFSRLFHSVIGTSSIWLFDAHEKLSFRPQNIWRHDRWQSCDEYTSDSIGNGIEHIVDQVPSHHRTNVKRSRKPMLQSTRRAGAQRNDGILRIRTKIKLIIYLTVAAASCCCCCCC